VAGQRDREAPDVLRHRRLARPVVLQPRDRAERGADRGDPDHRAGRPLVPPAGRQVLGDRDEAVQVHGEGPGGGGGVAADRAEARRAAGTTSARRPARWRAAARPIPLLAPATRTVRPRRSWPVTGSGAGCEAAAPRRGAGTAGGPAGSDGMWPSPAPPSAGSV